MPPEGEASGSSGLGRRRVARGWIAIGDDARGILLAIGSRPVDWSHWAGVPLAS